MEFRHDERAGVALAHSVVYEEFSALEMTCYFPINQCSDLYCLYKHRVLNLLSIESSIDSAAYHL